MNEWKYDARRVYGGRVDVANSGPRHQMLDEERQEVETTQAQTIMSHGQEANSNHRRRSHHNDDK